MLGVRGLGLSWRWCADALVAIALAVAMVACSGQQQGPPASLPLSEPAIDPDHTGPASQLAPSQLTASTVPAPALPGPCPLAELDMWTAQVSIGDGTADAVIRIHNLGEVVCEVDIAGSALLDAEIEPNVWIDPGGWADLVVGQSGRTCRSPELVTLADFDIHGDAVVVPTAAVVSCGWELTALFANEVATRPCDRLDTATVDRFVLLRNPGPGSCVLGELTAVDGRGAVAMPRTTVASASVRDLAAGDVVAIPYTVADTVECVSAVGPGSMTFDVAGAVPVEMIACGSLYEVGAARPWFSDPNGPLAAFDPEQFDVAVALATLDPFP